MESELELQEEPIAEVESLVEGLSVPQARAMDILMNGKSVTAAAVAAEVTRKTVYDWMRQPLFGRILKEWKRDVTGSVRTRLILSAENAAVVVTEAVLRGDVRTALKLLEKTGILAPSPEGPTMQEVQIAERLVCLERNRMRARAEAAVDQTVGAWSPDKYAGKDEDLGLGPEEDEEEMGGADEERNGADPVTQSRPGRAE